MKKLNLKLGSIKELLSKEQMKKVRGGEEYCYQSYHCTYFDGNDWQHYNNPCCYETCAEDAWAEQMICLQNYSVCSCV